MLQQILDSLAAQSPLEWCAAILTLIFVFYVVRGKSWAWPIGLVGTLIYVYIYWQFKLYSSVGLYLAYYLPVLTYGWWLWSKGGEDSLPPVKTLSKKSIVIAASAIAIFTPAWGYFIASSGAYRPYWDSFCTAISGLAQFLQTKRYIENWPLWLVGNGIYLVVLLPQQKAYPTMILFAILMGMAVLGWRQWSREQNPSPSVEN